MKREEKNQQSRRRILDSALTEFACRGYALGSINTICVKGDISKGILYHYFEDRDALYLACVGECFDALTDWLAAAEIPAGAAQAGLENYFRRRLLFFQENPKYERIFLEVMLTPPAHLAGRLAEIRAGFDAFNLQVLEALLEGVSLRPDVTRKEVADTLRQYQDFINAKYRGQDADAAAREQGCLRALSILLYGVIAREEPLR
ncbi:TetR/AcrR family transcriptional regulator [Anaerofilum sp. BX8]|uniref:TetR/AcrR family transcriptional regulator n=1 Tax=Anaerofilum hominis TaxID=2763016 RepID=A0A923I827_9FIRM|nr:TetR/AcrR family transcriptional regulator [Anaerofilum hominis]MBC5580677.1 TetR/AcrR family transcriptional regulator [Anaerofilum hominis]